MTAVDQATLWAPTRALTSDVARVLSTPTKSRPFWPPRTPRWILRCFDAGDANVPVTGGVYHVNRVVDETMDIVVQSSVGDLLDLQSFSLVANHSVSDGRVVETSLARYEQTPQEIPLDIIQTVVRINTQVPTLFSDNHDQLQWQLNVAAECIYEVKEHLLFNHPTYGLLNNVDTSMEFEAGGPPSPDVLDDLLARMWKRPDCFLMHPEALAEFHKQANSRSLALEAVELFGFSFTSWRGLPIFPTDKLPLASTSSSSESTPAAGAKSSTPAAGAKSSRQSSGQPQERSSGTRVRGPSATDVLLMRIGLEDQGVVSLYAEGTKVHPALRFITVESMGISDNAVAGYLLTTHVAAAVLSPGALAHARVTI